MVTGAGTFRRAAGAVAAATLLVAGVAGLPVALALLAGNPLPDTVPTADGLWQALTSPDDGTLFLGLLTVVGWLAWASFTASVVLEVVSRLTHRPAPAIPGLRGPQRLASALVAGVAALAMSPTLASSDAAPVEVSPAGPVTAADFTSPVELAGHTDRAVPQAPDNQVVHLVERGEGMLDLQERYGVPWQRIAEANYGVAQPDGSSLQRGQTRIYPGWQLRIPQQVTPATAAVEQVAVEHKEYEVAKGDWMWHIADRYLGDPERFRDIAALNPGYADRHGDFPDHIEPGWTLRLPEDAVDSGPTAHATGAAERMVPEGGTDSASPDEPPPSAVPEPPEQVEPVEPSEPVEPPEPVEPQEPAEHASTPSPEAEPTVAPTTPPPVVQAPTLPPASEATPPPVAEPTPPVAEPTPPVMEVTPPPALETPAPAVEGFEQQPVEPQAADQQQAPEESAAPADAPASDDPERLAPVALAGAGLLAALVLGAVSYHRLRRHPGHQPGTVATSAASRRLERTLRVAQQPLDAERLDAALRALAAGLATRDAPMPDIAGALVTDGAVELALHRRCPDPPEPWQASGDRWHLAADAALPEVRGPLAPLPALATVGSQPGRHVLLDLERLGVLTLYGQPEHTADLLRYLAAELAHHTWSDRVEVMLAGFPVAEAALLAELNPQRIRVQPSIAEAVTLLRRRVAAARDALRHTGVPDTLTGRVRGLAGDAWMPQVLLAADPSAADRAALSTLEHDIAAGGRCAVAVVTTALTHQQPGGWRVTLNPDGVMHVRQPFLHTSLAGASLPHAELELLAGAVRQARVAPVEPVPPAADAEAWAAGTDAGGALRQPDPSELAAPPAEPGSADAAPGADLETPPDRSAAGPGTATRPYADPDLDDDLRAWYSDDPGRPRIGVLGDVRVDAHGVPPEHRRRLHAELIVYLAQRGSRGADAELLDEALWPGTGVAATTRQMILSRARGWLGTDAGSNPWLTDVDADLTYRLAEGYLLDWHLFRRLRTRAQLRGTAGRTDLQAALRLVRGAPLSGADRPPAPGARNPYPWLPESDINADLLVAAVVDAAHQLAELCLEAGDTEGVRWAVQQAWLADAARSYDQPWRDLMAAAHLDGDLDRLRALLAELLEVRDAETPEDLVPDTHRLVHTWLPDLAALAGGPGGPASGPGAGDIAGVGETR